MKEKAATLLKMKANKKMVQQQLCQETGNIILLKDLSNIALAAKKGESRNDLDVTVQVLMEKYGMRISCKYACNHNKLLTMMIR